LAERESEWLGCLTTDPASFAAVEREVHEQAWRQADLYVAGLLAKAGEQPEMAQHVDAVIAAAEVPLRAVEKKTPPCGGASVRDVAARGPDSTWNWRRIESARVAVQACKPKWGGWSA
jgi:hypothetical protein